MQYLLIVCLLVPVVVNSQVTPMPHAHSHNDYLQHRPLELALRNGFTSIEVDVHLYRNKLKVSHIPIGLFAKNTIEHLYLEPLQKIVERNGGTVYAGYPVQLILMIDVKGNGAEVYTKLKQVLTKYRNILSTYQNGVEVKPGAVQVLLSGSVPVNEVAADTFGLTTIDARFSAMEDTIHSKWVTRYSSAWHKHFVWSGKREMPQEQQLVLASWVQKAHQQQKQIRFYHIPDKPRVWKVLLDNGVDWINTDQPTRFRQFYLHEYRR